jgi:hypothetical protein
MSERTIKSGGVAGVLSLLVRATAPVEPAVRQSTRVS